MADKQITLKTNQKEGVTIILKGKTGTKATIDWKDGTSQTVSLTTKAVEATKSYTTSNTRIITITTDGDNITYLDCNHNNISELGVSGNLALEELNCESNNLKELNVSGLSQLKIIECAWNYDLTKINTQGCTQLKTLDYSCTGLSSIDIDGKDYPKLTTYTDNSTGSITIRNCPLLTEINCEKGTVRNLTLIDNPKLKEIYTSSLSSLKIENCPNLEELFCMHSNLSALNLSGCSKLKKLTCSYCDLTSLNLSGCVSLEEIDCSYNKLKSLNLSELTNLKDKKIVLFDNNLSDTELNKLFTSLPTAPSTMIAQLFVAGNPGAKMTGIYKPSIAQDKNWYVDVDPYSYNLKTEINDGLRNIQYPNPDPLLNTSMFNEEAIANPCVKVDGGLLVLTQEEKTFSQKELYILGSGYQNIYPGAMVYVNGDITKGTPDPISDLQRAPVTIFGDFLAGATTMQKNVELTSGAINESVNNIMRILLADSSYKAPGMQHPTTKIYTSMKHMAMDFKVNSNFAGLEIKVDCKTSSTQSSFIHATTLEQDYFTIKLDDAWIRDPSILFAPNTTWADIKRIIGSRPIAIVTSVTYGRRFSYLREYSAKDYNYTGSQKVEGYSHSASSSQEVTEKITASADDIFNIGSTSLTKEVLSGKKTQEDIEKAMCEDMEFGKGSQGVVVKYTIAIITGANAGKIITPMYSGKYFEQTYKKYPNFFNIKVKKNSSFSSIAGASTKPICDCSFFTIENGKEVLVRKSKKATIRDETNEGLEQGTFEKKLTGYDNILISNMKAPAGAYYKNVQFRIRHNHIKYGKYYESVRGFIDDKSFQAGNIDIIIAGGQVAGGGDPYIYSESKTNETGKPTNNVLPTK
jgi:hypothetical protein